MGRELALLLTHPSVNSRKCGREPPRATNMELKVGNEGVEWFWQKWEPRGVGAVAPAPWGGSGMTCWVTLSEGHRGHWGRTWHCRKSHGGPA